MHTAKLDQMIRGWFVGNFFPTLYKTNAVEVAVKHYAKGQNEAYHYHKIATEITVIISGTIRMNNQYFSAGDIIVLQPGESSNFEALTDSINVVVKIPGANNDKYLGEL